MEELRIGLTVYPYAAETAMLAGRIDGEQTAKGVIIPFADLLIGATALSLGFSVFTVNLRHFMQIPGLNVISLSKGSQIIQSGHCGGCGEHPVCPEIS